VIWRTIPDHTTVKTLATGLDLSNFRFFNSKNSCESPMANPKNSSTPNHLQQAKSNPFKKALLAILAVMALFYVGYWFSQMVF
jgi:hypothetical protein